MLITENQLDEWVRGNSRDAQGVIVELVWRLVAASSPRPKERRFPLGDSIGQHGPDGLLDVDYPHDPFVPEGRSYWEIGTGVDAATKASSDYKDLVTEVPESDRLQSTFIFVTPLSGRRDWQHTWKPDAQATWLDRRKKKGEWRDVRVIDGTKLIDWMHQFPSVELWFAERTLNIPMEQVETLEQRWNLLCGIGEPPPLDPQVFMANRDEANAKFQEVLEQKAIQLKFETHYPSQVVDFLSACHASLDGERRVDSAGRCLIINGEDAWNTLVNYRDSHILIAESTLDLTSDLGTKLIQRARRAGHAVVFGGPAGGIPDPMSVRLPEPNIHQLKDALEKSGYNEERARMLAHNSGGNLGSLLRCLQNLSLMPEWAEGSAAAELAIAEMIGAWVESSAADQVAVGTLAGKAYGEWIGEMREITLRPGTPLTQRNGSWKFVPRYEGWYALGPKLFDEHLDRAQKVAVTVLTENDPQFELPPDERYASGIKGKILSHSQRLRNGLAEMLALLGSHPGALSSCTVGKPQAVAVLAVREILSDADWIRWAGLNDLLPLLAEAAPSEFLGAVESALQKTLSPFDEMFSQEHSGITGRTYMSGVLWALETLAWSTEHLSRVVMCLGELAARDPGGNWVNRPANSLTTILLPWLPQTCAPISKRRAAVTTLLSELPEVGWKLLLSLLPRAHSTTTGTRRPAWRDIIPADWSKSVTRGEYEEETTLYANMAVAVTRHNVDKLVELIDCMENLPLPAYEEILTYLESDAAMAFGETEREILWRQLSDLVRKHTRFSDAFWAIAPEQRERLALVAKKLEPKVPFFRYQQLFGERELDLYEEKGNYEEQRRQLDVRRREAIREIAEGGVDAVLGFAAEVESPWRVGMAFGAAADGNADGAILPALLEATDIPLATFSGGFVRGRFIANGWQWVDSIDYSEWTPAQVAQFLTFLAFEPDTWLRVSRLLGEEEGLYWERTSANPYECESGVERAIEPLIRYGRPHAALRCFNRLLHAHQPIDVHLAIRALRSALSVSESETAQDAYGTVEVIKALQSDPKTDRDEMAAVEWLYLPLLGRHSGASPKILWNRLANDPTFFCEAIRLVFRSKDEAPDSDEASEQEQAIAKNAYQLLTEWRMPPGCQEDGTFDEGAFNEWLSVMKRECESTGHLEIASTILGHSFMYAPADPGGLWIHRSVAAALNRRDAEDMRSGLSSELFNSRGVHTFTAGRDERALSDRYRDQAEDTEAAGYYRLATMLRALAASYDRQAEHDSTRDPFGDD